MKLYNCSRSVFKALMVLLPLYAHTQGIRIDAGAHVVVTGEPVLVLNNAGILNNGNFAAGNSKVVFAGNTAASVVAGNKPVSFYNIVIGKSSGDVRLDNNISVRGIIDMNSGNLQLNNYTLDLGSTGLITGERSLSCITGTNGGLIKAVTMLYRHRPVNPGNIGVEINSDNDPGQTLVTRGHQQQTSASGQTGIERYFDIVPVNKTNLHASLRFYYLDGELAGKDVDALAVFSSSEGQRGWTLWGKDKADVVSGWVAKSNISQQQRFTLSIPNGKSAAMGTQAGVAVQLFPNPSRDAFTVLLTSDTEKDGVIYLYDQLGRQLEGRKIHCQPGANRLLWDIRSYAAGSYYLVFDHLGVKNITLEKQ